MNYILFETKSIGPKKSSEAEDNSAFIAKKKKRTLSKTEIEVLILQMLERAKETRPQGLSTEQITRILRKHDEFITEGLVEAAILMLLIEDAIDEPIGGRFIIKLIDSNN